MKNYDYKSAKLIIKDYKKDGLVEASLGMKEDWFYTGETIWENNKYIIKLKANTEIGGIKGSNWATPIIELIFKDGSSLRLNCYKTE